jgi:hypothetical protein
MQNCGSTQRGTDADAAADVAAEAPTTAAVVAERGLLAAAAPA